MTVTNARLRDALAQWPLDREQRSLIDKALAGIDVDRTDQIVELLRTAQNSLIDFDFASSIADAPFESTSGFEATEDGLFHLKSARPRQPWYPLRRLRQQVEQLFEDFETGFRSPQFVAQTALHEGAGPAYVQMHSESPIRERTRQTSQSESISDLVQVIERVDATTQALQSSIASGSARSDSLRQSPISTQPGPTPMLDDQLQQLIRLLTATITTNSRFVPKLGEVNGALGETIGHLLNGKKTAIGIVGALVTVLLENVTTSPGAPGIGGLLGTIVWSVPGLSQFSLPVFLAVFAWGVLGKFEKWARSIESSIRLESEQRSRLDI